MKKSAAVFLFVILLFSLASCAKPYAFSLPTEKIEALELVSVYGGSIEVKKTLSAEERKAFLEDFEKIKFNEYIAGAPMTVQGKAFKITYEGGDYELICSFWAECTRGGQTYQKGYNCSEGEFDGLYEKYIGK